ncbi:MAG: nickel-dependent lactate racemase [Clostridia bacterium]|nr:nickel-dependent lactate racemase [Clostridia bacterium]
MQKIAVPYGDTQLDFVLDEGLDITHVNLNDYPVLENFEAAAAEALANPIASERLCDIVKPGEKVAVIISDFTRASYRTDLYLATLLDQCNAGGVPDSDITVVIATGYHAEATEEEKRILAGDEACRRVKVESHDCHAPDLVSYGKTLRGNDVYINHTVAAVDKVVLTGGICYHTFAGFGGGRKSVAPGVAGFSTIEGNHQNCFDRENEYEIDPMCNSGILDGNPVSEEMFEIAAMVNPAFLVNVIVNDHGSFCGIVAGDWREAYAEGVEIIKKIYGVRLDRKFDAAIISNGGAPKDVNLFQSVKGLHNAKFAMNPGASVVLCAQCFEGIGPEGYVKGFRMGSYEKLWEYLRYERYDPEMAIALLTMRYLRHMKVYLISDLPEDLVKLAGMTPVKTPAEAWSLILKDKPALKDVMVLPCGALTCPIVEL